jgi:hypothetical protein
METTGLPMMDGLESMIMIMIQQHCVIGMEYLVLLLESLISILEVTIFLGRFLLLFLFSVSWKESLYRAIISRDHFLPL